MIRIICKKNESQCEVFSCTLRSSYGVSKAVKTQGRHGLQPCQSIFLLLTRALNSTSKRFKSHLFKAECHAGTNGRGLLTQATARGLHWRRKNGSLCRLLTIQSQQRGPCCLSLSLCHARRLRQQLEGLPASKLPLHQLPRIDIKQIAI